MREVVEAASAVLMLAGGVFCLLAAVGVLRFPDVVCRLHAAAKAQSLGLLLVLLGAAAHVPAKYGVALLLVALFQLVTVPVTGQVVGRTAYRTRAVDTSGIDPDELADRLAADARAERGDRE